ncbi:hypothetical protein O9992_27545 [Vibrio lentus]|nr:hypothetical protein [Vibrio lentus]
MLEEALVEELENEIDELIELFSSARPDDLCRTLNAVRAIASRFEMTEVLELAVSQAGNRASAMPEGQLLQ